MKDTSEKEKNDSDFPWVKTVKKKILRNFPGDAEALQLLQKSIQEEFEKLFISKNTCRGEAFYKILCNFYLHFCFKIGYNEERYLIFYIVQLLYYLLYVGLILSRGDITSEWMNRILTVLKSFPGDIYMTFDALLLICNMKRKYHNAYALLLKNILCKESIKIPADAESYIKVMLLFRRLKFLSEGIKKKSAISFIASKVKCPPDFQHWVSSLNINNFCDDNCCSKASQKLLNKKLKRSVLKKFIQALFENKYAENIINPIKYENSSNVTKSTKLNNMNLRVDEKCCKRKSLKNKSKKAKLKQKLLKKKCLKKIKKSVKNVESIKIAQESKVTPTYNNEAVLAVLSELKDEELSDTQNEQKYSEKYVNLPKHSTPALEQSKVKFIDNETFYTKCSLKHSLSASPKLKRRKLCDTNKDIDQSRTNNAMSNLQKNSIQSFINERNVCDMVNKSYGEKILHCNSNIGKYPLLANISRNKCCAHEEHFICDINPMISSQKDTSIALALQNLQFNSPRQHDSTLIEFAKHIVEHCSTAAATPNLKTVALDSLHDISNKEVQLNERSLNCHFEESHADIKQSSSFLKDKFNTFNKNAAIIGENDNSQCVQKVSVNSIPPIHLENTAVLQIPTLSTSELKIQNIGHASDTPISMMDIDSCDNMENIPVSLHKDNDLISNSSESLNLQLNSNSVSELSHTWDRSRSIYTDSCASSLTVSDENQSYDSESSCKNLASLNLSSVSSRKCKNISKQFISESESDSSSKETVTDNKTQVLFNSANVMPENNSHIFSNIQSKSLPEFGSDLSNGPDTAQCEMPEKNKDVCYSDNSNLEMQSKSVVSCPTFSDMNSCTTVPSNSLSSQEFKAVDCPESISKKTRRIKRKRQKSARFVCESDSESSDNETIKKHQMQKKTNDSNNRYYAHSTLNIQSKSLVSNSIDSDTNSGRFTQSTEKAVIEKCPKSPLQQTVNPMKEKTELEKSVSKSKSESPNNQTGKECGMQKEANNSSVMAIEISHEESQPVHLNAVRSIQSDSEFHSVSSSDCEYSDFPKEGSLKINVEAVLDEATISTIEINTRSKNSKSFTAKSSCKSSLNQSLLEIQKQKGIELPVCKKKQENTLEYLSKCNNDSSAIQPVSEIKKKLCYDSNISDKESLEEHFSDATTSSSENLPLSELKKKLHNSKCLELSNGTNVESFQVHDVDSNSLPNLNENSNLISDMLLTCSLGEAQENAPELTTDLLENYFSVIEHQSYNSQILGNGQITSSEVLESMNSVTKNPLLSGIPEKLGNNVEALKSNCSSNNSSVSCLKEFLYESCNSCNTKCISSHEIFCPISNENSTYATSSHLPCVAHEQHTKLTEYMNSKLSCNSLEYQLLHNQIHRNFNLKIGDNSLWTEFPLESNTYNSSTNCDTRFLSNKAINSSVQMKNFNSDSNLPKIDVHNPDLDISETLSGNQNVQQLVELLSKNCLVRSKDIPKLCNENSESEKFFKQIRENRNTYFEHKLCNSQLQISGTNKKNIFGTSQVHTSECIPKYNTKKNIVHSVDLKSSLFPVVNLGKKCDENDYQNNQKEMKLFNEKQISATLKLNINKCELEKNSSNSTTSKNFISKAKRSLAKRKNCSTAKNNHKKVHSKKDYSSTNNVVSEKKSQVKRFTRGCSFCSVKTSSSFSCKHHNSSDLPVSHSNEVPRNLIYTDARKTASVLPSNSSKRYNLRPHKKKEE